MLAHCSLLSQLPGMGACWSSWAPGLEDCVVGEHSQHPSPSALGPAWSAAGARPVRGEGRRLGPQVPCPSPRKEAAIAATGLPHISPSSGGSQQQFLPLLRLCPLQPKQALGLTIQLCMTALSGLVVASGSHKASPIPLPYTGSQRKKTAAPSRASKHNEPEGYLKPDGNLKSTKPPMFPKCRHHTMVPFGARRGSWCNLELSWQRLAG